MKIEQYLNKLNEKSQEIYTETITDTENLGKTHHYASFIAEFSENISDENEKKMIVTVATQLESATLNMIYGMYRQAYSSLRLAFELGLGAIHFSIHKLEHYEWIKGNNDIKWSKLIDEENGVISERFSKAFFPELKDLIKKYNDQSRNVYRKLSEFVHGNNGTWTKSGLTIQYNEDLKKDYFNFYKTVSEILIFVFCCRYLKAFNQEQKEKVSLFILEEMQHISPIREFLGGVKEM
jgi:5'-deoxynucleotidase YfbR-like HD superfamily hydrolase